VLNVGAMILTAMRLEKNMLHSGYHKSDLDSIQLS